MADAGNLDQFKPCPPIEIEGRKYQPRRLGLFDLFTIGQTIKEVIAMGGLELGTRLRGMNLKQKETWIAVFALGTPAAQDKILDHVASILCVGVDDIKDPTRFPLGSETLIIKGLSQHPDLHKFFFALLGEERGKEMFGRLTAAVSGWVLTSFYPVTEELPNTGSESPTPSLSPI